FQWQPYPMAAFFSPSPDPRRIHIMQNNSESIHATPGASLVQWPLASILALGASVLLPAVHQAQSPIYVLAGDNIGDQIGIAVDTAMDVNLDGFPDILAGASSWDDPNGGDEGRVYVYSGMDGMSLFVFQGDAAGMGLGNAV